MKFGTRIRQRLSINTINENVVNPESRELHGIVVDILKTIPRINLYGYKIGSVDPEQDFRMTNVDYLHKTKSTRVHIDMSQDIIDCLTCYFIIDDNCISEKFSDYAKSNMKKEALTLDLDWVDERLKHEVLSFDKNMLPTGDPKTRESQFLKISLYVPRLKNNVLTLNGNHYFNKYFLAEGARITRNGDMVIQHHSYTSYLGVTDDIFRVSIFGKTYNPFHFCDASEEFISYILDDIACDEDRNKYNEILRNTIQCYEDFMEEIDDDLELDIEDKKNIITKSDIIEGIRRYIHCAVNGNVVEDTLSLHSSLKKNLRIEIMQSLKLTGGKLRRTDLVEFKAKRNLDPRTVCTIIKKYKQYALSKSTNEIDLYNFFGYVSTIEEDEETVAKTRNFTPEQLGLICPLSSSTSTDNVGLAGMLVFSVPDSKIKLVE